MRKEMRYNLTERIQNVERYFDTLLEDLPPSANLIILIDPQKFLRRKLNSEYTDTTGKTWRVYHYCENDFSFRREYSNKPKDIVFSHIIWITFPEFPEIRKKNRINLSYICDIITRADRTVDLGLTAVLKKLAPRETWLEPEELFEYSTDISENLDKFIELHKELRKEIPQDAPLGINHIRAIVLACRNPRLAVKDLVFRELDTLGVLLRYLKLASSCDLNRDEIKHLRDLVKGESHIDTTEILPWMTEDTSDLAVFLFLMHIFRKYNVSNPLIQLKGLGLLAFDPEKLDKKQTDAVLTLMGKESGLFTRITEMAESKISVKDISRFVECIPFKSQNEIGKAIIDETSPLMVFGLSTHLLKKMEEKKVVSLEVGQWAKDVPNHPILKGNIEKELPQKASNLLWFFFELNLIQNIIGNEFEAKEDIATLIDWYRDSKVYSLELAFARASRYLKVLEDQKLKKSIVDYLDKLGVEIRKYLQLADSNLSSLIDKNIRDYFSHPRLSANVLKDNVINRGILPTDERRLWVLIFDGMRLDTWEQVVKPMISNKFAIDEEKLYLCVLPSYTNIARIALLSGCLPKDWKDYNGKLTSDHNILASRLFGLSKTEGREKLRITVSSEADFAQRKLDEYMALYNVLIYNLSDDWIHNHRGDIGELNDEIEQRLRKNIVPDLEARIGENDLVLITSDHGFIELSKDDGIRIYTSEEDERKISYRHLDSMEHSSGLKIQYDNNRFFTVAKGRKWFERGKGKFTRYAHGGISLSEMVIPAATLRKIITPEIKFEIEYPQRIVAVEDSTIEIELTVINVGNQKGEFVLVLQANTGEEKIFREASLAKKEFKYQFSLMATLKLKNVSSTLSYLDADKKEVKETRNLPVTVTPRKDKVELGLGALDRLGED